ncbi:hypothetical protein NST23_09245 [Brevibacillus sp. FSL K6-0770]
MGGIGGIGRTCAGGICVNGLTWAGGLVGCTCTGGHGGHMIAGGVCG